MATIKKRGSDSIMGKFGVAMNVIQSSVTAANVAHRFGSAEESATHIDQAAEDCETLARQLRQSAADIRAGL